MLVLPIRWTHYSATRVSEKGDVVEPSAIDLNMTEAVVLGGFAAFSAISVALINKINRGNRWSKEIYHEVRNNGGTSLKDGVDRMLRHMDSLEGKVDRLNDKVEYVKEGVGNNRSEIERLRTKQEDLDKAQMMLGRRETDRDGD